MTLEVQCSYQRMEGETRSPISFLGGHFLNKSIFRHIIIGVTSYGTGCAHPDYPGVYARVTEVKSWIELVALDTKDSDCKRKLQQFDIGLKYHISLSTLMLI